MPALSPPSAWMWQLNSCAWVTGMKCAVWERSGVKVAVKYIPFLVRKILGSLKHWNYKTRLGLMLCYSTGSPNKLS